MRNTKVFTVLMAALVMTAMFSGSALAQKQMGPMKMYHIVMAEKGPKWESQNSEKGMEVRLEVISNIQAGAEKGVIISAGLVNDETDVEFILIIDVETKTEAFSILESSKYVKSGFYKPVIYSYFAPDGLTVQGKK